VGSSIVSIPRAIIIGGYVNGLGLARALAARDVATVVITTKPYDIAHRSRWVSAHETALDVEEAPEQLVDILEARAAEWAGAVVFPTNDGALAALAQHRERLAASYRVVAPPYEIARRLLDKSLMSDAAREVGLDVPRCYGPAVSDTAARRDLCFPVVVKPTESYRFFSRFGCKLFAARDRAELESCIARFAEAGLRGQVFDLVPGPDSQIHAYCTYIDRHGDPCGGLTLRKIRQSPPFFGVARVAELAAENPMLREATIELARRIGFRGMATTEFKLDPRDGRMRFIEINGRSVLYNSLLRKAGLDLAGLAWSEHTTGHAEAVVPSSWSGVWIHLHADILYSVLYRRHDPVALAEFLAPYRRPKIFAVWSASDPMPFVHQWAQTALTGLSTLVRGTYRDLFADRASPNARP
jgi:D-aspartate ligase